MVRLRAEWGDTEAARLLPACSTPFVSRWLPGLVHAVDDWRRLARRHPDPVLDHAEAALADRADGQQREDWWRLHATTVAALARPRPERARGRGRPVPRGDRPAGCTVAPGGGAARRGRHRAPVGSGRQEAGRSHRSHRWSRGKVTPEVIASGASVCTFGKGFQRGAFTAWGTPVLAKPVQ